MNATASRNRLREMVGAFAYLYATSFANRMRQRLLRLRQPKYLFGALVGGAYMYFFFFRKVMLQGGHGNAPAPGIALGPGSAGDLEAMAAILLAVVVLLNWLLSGERARLSFSEAEIAFLFPAPLTRTTLIQFNLLRAQLGIFFSSFLMGLFLRRGGAFGAGTLQYATGIWLVLSILNLHLLAASFTRERLLDLGVKPWRRRAIAAGVVLLAGVACWWSMRDALHWPAIDTASDIGALRPWFEGIVGTAPLSWLLLPFRWVVAPIFAQGTPDFLRALVPAFALLALHYLWVVRSQVSFEEASMVHARRRAERVAAMREGRIGGQRAPTKPRGEPWRLAAGGHASLAFLWKGLIAMGGFFRLRTWLIVCVATFALCQWLAADPQRRIILTVIGAVVPVVGTWFLLLGPMMMQRGLRRTLENMDILKAAPLRGWQIALGEILTPMAVMSFALWWLLLVAAQAALAHVGHVALSSADVLAGAGSLALLAPPLCGLMVCVPFAGMLYFPAWTAAPGAGGRGVEVMGQRLIFMGGYLLTLLVASIPAALVGGIGYLLGKWLAGSTAALVVAAVFAGAMLAFELACAVDLLGRRIDRFDVSQEMR